MTRIERIRDVARQLLMTEAGSPEELAIAQQLKSKLIRCQLDPNDFKEGLRACADMLRGGACLGAMDGPHS